MSSTRNSGWDLTPNLATLMGLFRINRTNAPFVAIALVVVATVGDFVTNVELVFTLIYLVPILVAAWFRSRAFALVVAAIAALSACGVEIRQTWTLGRDLQPMHLVWNHAGSFLLYVAFVVFVAKLREYSDVERRTQQATVAQLRQAERLGVVGQLAAGLAHELGTPLNVILGHNEMVASPKTPQADREASCRVIASQTTKMTKIIRGLLDFSRRGRGERESVDLALVAKASVMLAESLAKKQGSEIDLVVDGAVPVTACATEIEQVLLNLMMNGLQAMPNGGRLRVTIYVDRRANGPPFARVDVEDEGSGIAADDLPRIFDPFFTTKDVGAGTGLGLSVSYGIVTDHGGRLDVVSTVGRGSTFSVLLPAVE